uniref:Uncharacterized protein n=1 Tax=Trichuris muris TaxID=70415 RepID=A0A5S6QEX4_TRIMR
MNTSLWTSEWKYFGDDDKSSESKKKKKQPPKRRSVIQGNLDVLAGVAEFPENTGLPTVNYMSDPNESDSAAKKKKKKDRKSKSEKQKRKSHRQSVEEGNLSVLSGNPKFTSEHAGLDRQLAMHLEKMESKAKNSDSENQNLTVGIIVALIVGFTLNSTLGRGKSP